MNRCDLKTFLFWMQSSIHRSADATLDYAGRFITFNGSAGYTNMQVKLKSSPYTYTCLCSWSTHRPTGLTRDELIMTKSFHVGWLSCPSRSLGNRAWRRGLCVNP
jgi:hypothetical protein